MHSLWALLAGAAFMWLGARNYTYLRVAVFHIAFIWTTSLLVPALVSGDRALAGWRLGLKLAINYFNKNFYQQILFFLLPIYYASATWGSSNFWFVGVIAVSAVLSTLDVLYERHVSVKRGLAAVFFAFNLFVSINVMLPVVWRVSNARALPISAVLALVAFITIGVRVSDVGRVRTWAIVVIAAVLIAATVRWGGPLIPPAPLRLRRAEFATGFDRTAFRSAPAVATLPAGWSGQLHAFSAIHAPLGLEDRVAHRWFVDGRLAYAPGFYTVRGGREEGFRLWTHHHLNPLPAGATLRLDVVTEAGQLIGRTKLTVGRR